MIDLRHGDCLELLKDIPDGSVDLILTDPPYNTTQAKWDCAIDLDALWVQLKRIIKPNGAIVMTASQPFTSKLVLSNLDMFKYEYTWIRAHKSGHLNAKKRPMTAHESVLVFYDKRPKYDPVAEPFSERSGMGATPTATEVYGGIKNQTEYKRPNYKSRDSVIEGYPVDDRGLHSTQKPTKLLSHLIEIYTGKGDTVIDMFMGSGSTGVACVNTNRKFIGIELDPEYFKIAEERINTAAENSGFFMSEI
ncbi:DNA-methyltransferase [Psychrobacter sp.]|uniref:DNA-methyltransferase n=1 Tax=Psychrobacter sp. TaxID=56811 RepID=UPI003C72A25C